MNDPILIVGAGPTGLTLACELLRHGVSCRIIDRLSEASPFSKALAIQPRTMELFEKAGVVDQFLEKGWKLNAFNVFNRRKHIVRMTFAEIESQYPFVVSLPQSETEYLLHERLLALGGCVERGLELVGLHPLDEGVDATFRSSDGSEARCRYSWLVGCDGSHSAVRHFIDLPFLGSRYQERYVLADVEFETSLDTSEFYIFSDRHELAGFHPFSALGARIFAGLDISSDGKTENVTLSDLQAYIDRRGPGCVSLKKLNWLSTFFVHRRQVQCYRNNRVFLAGDAAHIHSPASGQGMNVGIQDAFNLAWKLALVVRQIAEDRLLDSYNFERHAAGRGTLRMTDFFSRINTLKNPLARLVRDTLGPVLSRIPYIRRRYRDAVTELSVNYRRSSIVADGSKGRVPNRVPGPGERSPDGVISLDGKSARLFDLMRDTRHHLLVFSDRSDWTAFESCHLGVHLIFRGQATQPSVVGDVDGSLHRKYGALTSALYLIRPDGYVAYRNIPACREKFLAHVKRYPVRLAI